MNILACVLYETILSPRSSQNFVRQEGNIVRARRDVETHRPTLDKSYDGAIERQKYIPILILVFLVDAAHERGGRWQDLVDEDEDGLLGGELDAFADYVHELTDSEVGRDEVLLLVDGCNVRFLDLLADHWDAVGVFLALEKKVKVSWCRDGDMGGRGSWKGDSQCVRPQPCASRMDAHP